ncbi:hypothetical protein ACOME3_010721 [Neoechinorhynchus agilis]
MKPESTANDNPINAGGYTIEYLLNLQMSAIDEAVLAKDDEIGLSELVGQVDVLESFEIPIPSVVTSSANRGHWEHKATRIDDWERAYDNVPGTERIRPGGFDLRERIVRFKE